MKNSFYVKHHPLVRRHHNLYFVGLYSYSSDLRASAATCCKLTCGSKKKTQWRMLSAAKRPYTCSKKGRKEVSKYVRDHQETN